jgi:hypothetical protein
MLNSKVDVANRALYAIGAKPISDIADPSTPSAVVLNLIFDHVADAVITNVDQPFSSTLYRSQLAQVSGGTNLTQYDYMYNLPALPYCLRLLDILDQTHFSPLMGVDYLVENRVLYTNLDTVYIRYVGRTAIGSLDPWVREAIAMRLAFELATRLTEDDAKVQLAASLMQKAAVEAQAAEGKLQKITPHVPQSWESIQGPMVNPFEEGTDA